MKRVLQVRVLEVCWSKEPVRAALGFAPSSLAQKEKALNLVQKSNQADTKPIGALRFAAYSLPPPAARPRQNHKSAGDNTDR